jgi:hypothetical protein
VLVAGHVYNVVHVEEVEAADAVDAVEEITKVEVIKVGDVEEEKDIMMMEEGAADIMSDVD